MELRYYITRLRLMPFREIIDRILVRLISIFVHFQVVMGFGEWGHFKLENQVCRRRFSGGARKAHKRVLPNKDFDSDCPSPSVQNLLQHDFRTRGMGAFFFDHNDREKLLSHYQDLFPQRIEEIKRRADELSAHTFFIFGRRFHFEQAIPWLCDPLSNRQWPPRYSTGMINGASKRTRNIKWIWELNRHQFLVTLGKAYFLTQDERYAGEVCNLIKQWIDANPPLFGVNWTSALECSIRLISWIWTLHLVKTSKSVTSTFLRSVYSSVYLQTRYIETHLSTYSAANNHLIAEAAALAVVSICFPCFRSSDRWHKKGIEILTRQVTEQIYADGVFAEQSIHYGIFILDSYLSVLLLLRRKGEDVPAIWYKRLENAGEFLVSLMDSKGKIPDIGDNDGGQMIQLCEQLDFNVYESTLTTLSVILNRGDFKKAGKMFDEKSLWLIGIDGYKQYRKVEKLAPSNNSKIFAQGGYCILRNHGTVLTFDCGALGYGSHAGHGHADALSITLSVHGSALLIDPGMPFYGEKPAIRDHFRGTAAHNTVRVDGEDQSTIGDTFLWLKKAEARIEKSVFTSGYDYVSGVHNGYRELGVMHRRQIVFIKGTPFLGYWIITDDLTGYGRHLIELYWHFCAEGHLELQEDRIAVLRAADSVLTAATIETPQLQPTVYQGNKSPFQG